MNDRSYPMILSARSASIRTSGTAGRMRNIPEGYDWEQVRESKVRTLPQPTLGDLDVPGSPLRLVEHTDPRREAPPALGGDHHDVVAGYAARDGR